MKTLEDIETRQAELLKKIQALFQNKKRTQRDMRDLTDEIVKFEKDRAALLSKEILGETKTLDKFTIS